MRKLFALALCPMAFFAAQAAAADLVVVDGKLTGATGVDVGGTLYDVQFLDGSCASIFNGCDEPSDFTFTTLTAATVAGQALRDQVFLGAFDTDPSLISGCSGAVAACVVAVPYKFDLGSQYEARVWNLAGSDPDSITPGARPSFDSRDDPSGVYAFFSISSAVPEPGTWAMMLLGFGCIGAGMRRRNREQRLVMQVA